MADLKKLVLSLGFTGVKTLLQSGNLVFEGDGRSGSALERLLEKETAKVLEVPADYIIRNAEEWPAIIANNPFPKEAEADPSHMVVMFFKKMLLSQDVEALQSGIKGPEIVQAAGRELYLVYPDGIGTSKLTSSLIEKKLGSPGTARNWNTVLKLAAMTQE